MSIDVMCLCGKRLRAKPELAGKQVRCPACGKAFVVPADNESSAIFMAEVATNNDIYKFMNEALIDDSEGYSLKKPDEPYNPRSLVLGNDYIASNPGRFQVNFLKYSLSNPLWPAIWLGGLAVSLVLATGVHYVWSAAVIFFVIANIIYWLHVHEHFRHGCVCPALLLSDEAGLVAVYDYLTMGRQPYPVIKIIREPVHRMTGGPFRSGTRLAAVAIYRGKPEVDGRWTHFYPKIVHCVTMSRKKIDRVLGNIPEKQWHTLLDGLDQLSQPYRPGLYPINTKSW